MRIPLDRLLPLLAVVLVSMATPAIAGCSVAKVSGADAQIPANGINQALLDAAILAEINYQRCRKGLPRLTAASGLRKVATGHASWMAKVQKVTHKSTVAGRRSLSERLHRSGVDFRTGAENIGMFHFYQVDGREFLIKDAGSCHFTTYDGTTLPRHSYGSLAKSAVAYWMGSSGHRANILNRQVRYMGAGASVNHRGEFCGTVYMTQDFAG